MPETKDAVLAKLATILGAKSEEEAFADIMKDYADTDIVHSGTKITLPALPHPMSEEEAITCLQEKLKDQQTLMDVYEVIDAYPLDGAVAFMSALKQKYGWARAVPKPGFFGPSNPDMITVEISATESIQVPWGRFQIPNIESPIELGVHRGENGPVLVLQGEVRKKEQQLLKDIANLTREILKTQSIYQGKPISLDVSSSGELEFKKPPKFMNLSTVKIEELVLSNDTAAQVQASLWTPIQNTKRCLEIGIPLNRGVLLEGTYGTGKSMTALTTAKICEQNGWTFILLDRAQGLKQALLFAQRYEPCVVFVEDIDRAISSRKQESSNDLLNTIDGVLTKSSKVITVMTTNHVEQIDKAMMRPGRLDAVISIAPPDAEAVGRLITQYSRGLLAEGETLERIGAELSGHISATIREVVERSKLGMVQRGDLNITEDDLLVAASGMKRHLELLNGPGEPIKSPAERLGEAFEELSGGVTPDQVSTLLDTTYCATVEHMERILDHWGERHTRLLDKMHRGGEQQSKQVSEIHEEVCE